MSDSRKKLYLKLLLIAIIIFLLAAVIYYIIFAMAYIWQTLASGIIIGVLFIINVIFLILILHLWIRNIFLQRNLKKCQKEFDRITKNKDNSED